MTNEGASVYKINLIRSLNFARIRVDRYGRDIVADIRLKLRELCLQRWDVIHLVLPLADPNTSQLCRPFEELGFFFAGILPLGLVSGDALILQYLNTFSVRYSAIQTASRFASDLLAYVKARVRTPPQSNPSPLSKGVEKRYASSRQPRRLVPLEAWRGRQKAKKNIKGFAASFPAFQPLLASGLNRIYKSRTSPDHGRRRGFSTPRRLPHRPDWHPGKARCI